MSSRDIMAISRAEVTWFWVLSSRPFVFSKTVFFMPSSAARAFIFETKADSLPQICSARATAASFAEAITTLFTISRTLICSPSLRKICEPPIDVAWAEAVTVSSQPRAPPSIASIMISRVIILVTDAGGRASSAFFS